MGGKPFCCAERPRQILAKRNKGKRNKALVRYRPAQHEKRDRRCNQALRPYFLFSYFR